MIRLLCIFLFAAAIAGEMVKESKLSSAMEMTLRGKLRNTRLPLIGFRECDAYEALEFLASKTRGTEADIGMILRFDEAERKHALALALAPQPAVPPIPGLEAVGKNPPAGPPRLPTLRPVTWRGNNVSVEEILDEICRQAKLQWKLTPRGISVTPAFPPKRVRR